MKITNIEKQNILEKYYKSNSYNIITEQIYARGELVGQIQQELKNKGFDPGKADNLMGPRTINALAKALGIESAELPPIPQPKKTPQEAPQAVEVPKKAETPAPAGTTPAQAPAQQQGTPAPAQEPPGVPPAQPSIFRDGIKPEDA
jgi:peptidoglycan hydrolase-like protein with peptidoglycan-binding domain